MLLFASLAALGRSSIFLLKKENANFSSTCFDCGQYLRMEVLGDTQPQFGPKAASSCICIEFESRCECSAKCSAEAAEQECLDLMGPINYTSDEVSDFCIPSGHSRNIDESIKACKANRVPDRTHLPTLPEI